MEPLIQKLDLHVHTPSSSDYAGPKTDAEYTAILKKCRAANVSAVAITDHNTVNGCITFNRLKQELKSNYEFNVKREVPKEFLDQLKEELSLFEDISILHGVEVSVYPNIHIILIFDSNVDLAKVNTFLKNDLGLGDAVDNGSPDNYFSQAPTELLKLAKQQFGDTFLCILPHIDSTNGALQDLDGTPRADIFTAPEVLAVQIVNPDTKKYLTTHLLKSKEYIRKIPFGVIQASDYHGGNAGEIARQHFSITFDSRITFASLRQYFLHQRPIKISSDTIDEQYSAFIEERKVVNLDFKNGLNVNDESIISLFTDHICACLNTPDTLLEIKILNSNLTPQDEANKLAELIDKQIIQRLDPPLTFNFRIADVSYSPTRQRHIIEIKNNFRLRMSNTKALIYLKGKIVPASTRDIEQIVARNIFNRFGKSKQNSLERASSRLLMISNSFSAVSTAYRIDQLINRSILKKLEKSIEAPEYDKVVEECVREYNGVVDGDFYLPKQYDGLRAGRLNNYYFRLSAPAYAAKDGKVDIANLKTVITKQNCIIVFPRGGVHFVEKPLPLYAQFPFQMFSPIEDEKTPVSRDEMLGLAVFLKSSFLLWYLLTIHETDDLFEFMMRNYNRLPVPADKKLLVELTDFGKVILEDEKQLLTQLSLKSTQEKRLLLIDQHNEKLNKRFREIDIKILKSFQFSSTEIDSLTKTLDDLRLSDYGMKNETELVRSLVCT
jgi:PHP domain